MRRGRGVDLRAWTRCSVLFLALALASCAGSKRAREDGAVRVHPALLSLLTAPPAVWAELTLDGLTPAAVTRRAVVTLSRGDQVVARPHYTDIQPFANTGWASTTSALLKDLGQGRVDITVALEDKQHRGRLDLHDLSLRAKDPPLPLPATERLVALEAVPGGAALVVVDSGQARALRVYAPPASLAMHPAPAALVDGASGRGALAGVSLGGEVVIINKGAVHAGAVTRCTAAACLPPVETAAVDGATLAALAADPGQGVIAVRDDAGVKILAPLQPAQVYPVLTLREATALGYSAGDASFGAAFFALMPTGVQFFAPTGSLLMDDAIKARVKAIKDVAYDCKLLRIADVNDDGRADLIYVTRADDTHLRVALALDTDAAEPPRYAAVDAAVLPSLSGAAIVAVAVAPTVMGARPRIFVGTERQIQTLENEVKP